MQIYEITAIVDPSIASEYESYMTTQHIPDLLATGNFAAAFFAKNGGEYRIGYHANSSADVEEYFSKNAERLRADFAKHFPDGVEVTRKTLDIIALFPSPTE